MKILALLVSVVGALPNPQAIVLPSQQGIIPVPNQQGTVLSVQDMQAVCKMYGCPGNFRHPFCLGHQDHCGRVQTPIIQPITSIGIDCQLICKCEWLSLSTPATPSWTPATIPGIPPNCEAIRDKCDPSHCWHTVHPNPSSTPTKVTIWSDPSSCCMCGLNHFFLPNNGCAHLWCHKNVDCRPFIQNPLIRPQQPQVFPTPQPQWPQTQPQVFPQQPMATQSNQRCCSCLLDSDLPGCSQITLLWNQMCGNVNCNVQSQTQMGSGPQPSKNCCDCVLNNDLPICNNLIMDQTCVSNWVKCPGYRPGMSAPYST